MLEENLINQLLNIDFCFAVLINDVLQVVVQSDHLVILVVVVDWGVNCHWTLRLLDE